MVWHIYAKVKVPGTHLIGGWMNPRTHLNMLKRKICTAMSKILHPTP
jgi:hypothetical protein